MLEPQLAKPSHERAPGLQVFSAQSLLSMRFEPIEYVVPRYIAEGLTILAGRPKAGKSWLALDLAIAVATGGLALHKERCEQGDVLYLALEDNKRRLNRRIRQVSDEGTDLSRLHLVTTCPRFDAGGLEAIQGACSALKRPRLVIVDVLGQVRPERSPRDGFYADDYKALTPLKHFADDHALAVLVLHHVSKREVVDDPFDAVSGTTGLTGAADTILVLSKGLQGPTLYGRGRDIEEIETALRFDSGKWIALGEASEVRRSDERSRIEAVLCQAREPLGPQEIATLSDMTYGNVRKLLGKMVASGEVMKEARGRYVHPGLAPDHNDHNITN